MTDARRFRRTFAFSSSAWFLFALDRLVVTTAVPAIRTDLRTDVADTTWIVNAYPLAFAVLLLSGAALGDRFARRRMFTLGMAIFTGGSALAAVAPSVEVLVAARAIQGAGGAIFTPLALALLAAVTPPERRGGVVGAWGAVGGLGVAAGPLVGGVLTDTAGWPWIFWIDVPLGVLLVGLAPRWLVESRGPHRKLDLRGMVLVTAGILGPVWALVEAGTTGWTRWQVSAALGTGALALAMFVWWERRAASPMLPMRLFTRRAFSTACLAALLMYAALFGALFLVTQLLQTGLGADPLDAGARMMPMVVMPMLLTPLSGVLADRWGTRPLLVAGVGLVGLGAAGLAVVAAPDVSYLALIPAFVAVGAGSGVFFAPVTVAILGGVDATEQGIASGAATAVREVGAVLGVALLGSVLTGQGELTAPDRFIAGEVPAFWGAAALGVAGVLAALAVPTFAARRPACRGPDGAKLGGWRRSCSNGSRSWRACSGPSTKRGPATARRS